MTAGPEYRSVFEYCLQDSALQEVREVTGVHEPPVHTKNPSHSHGVAVCPKEDLQDDEQPERESSLGRDVSDRMVCSACQCPFDSREEQMEHYKLDWHRFNLRHRPSGQTPATVEEFERKTGVGDMSSISGSDSEDEEPDSDWVVENAEAVPLQKDVDGGLEEESFGRLSNRVVFQNSQGQYLAVYRCVLQSKSAIEEDLVASLQSLSDKTMWVILMAGGGHFAGAVFQGRDVLQHKTFHRYTVRAKRGTSQGLRDAKNSSHAPKSAGAALRRYNEAALVKEIQDLLESWSDHLTEASAIFLRAPSHNKTMFLGGKAAPLVKKDPRIRTLPFPTRRATFREIKRVHDVLSTLNVYGKDTDISDILSPSNKVWKKARTPVAQPEPYQETTAPLVEEEESSGEELELETVEVTLGTLDLREYEIYPARRKKRKERRRTEDRGLSNREAVGSPAAAEDTNQERGGEKNQERGGEKNQGRGGEKNQGRGGEKNQERGGEKNQGRGGEKNQGRGGEKNQERGGEKNQERGGEKNQERGGEKNQGRGGEKNQERGGEKNQGRGGEKNQERGGEKNQGRGGEKNQGRGGEKNQERGGEKNQGRGGEKNQERGGEKNQERRKPKGKKTIQHEEEEPDESWDYGLRDALYTACKTGDLDTLIRLLPVRRGEQGGEEGDQDGQREEQGAKPEGEKNQGEVEESCSSQAPVALAPAALNPAALNPAALNPAAQAPAAQAPAAQVPAAQAPAALAPAAQAPAAQVPAAQAPAALAPAAQAPAALNPAALNPAAQAPAALNPAALNPAAQAPAAQAPAALAPAALAPAAQAPAALNPAALAPAAQAPAALNPAALNPAAQAPAAQAPAALAPAAQAPAALNPAALNPAAQAPAAQAPAAQAPAAQVPAALSPLALLNQPIDSSGFTLLHVASAAGQKGVAKLLMDAGSDPACKDQTGQTPYIVAPDKDTRNMFRKYMADHPDKYNYSKALVPGPLTAELESKKTEKKKAQKAAKKTREKEQREQRKKLEMEAEEKKRFASLSDREKRAQAAEKRLAEHKASTGGDLSNTRRCWQCGESLVGKVPFQYLDFSFCTPLCVQEHRKANVANRSTAAN
ncbi:ankyrin repeat and zinc finger domain-containing protein 1 isoform X2 [Salvelinus fontinalis]|nr:ankyrin repeat and zinc finger domain-containing protein 1 isoform X2 [Salvelinus fontinalis]XP_055727857.1 ankyrin repeat and zinc finger domain-containing protein 1 isoform X2 [Salvelinus fontinalis]